LEKECVWGKIYVTGNTVIDAVNQHLPLAERKSCILKEISFKKFALATAHRAENVDNEEVLQAFMGVFSESPIPLVYPMHPRTKKRLKEKGMYTKMKKLKNVLILPPLGYLDFLVLMKKSEFIITDSGGIQEEATAPAIRKTTLVMRLSTERQEAVEAGFATIVGTKKDDILKAVCEAVENPKKLPAQSPFGDGFAAQKTVDIIKKDFV
jgi:UDP-N-acetylglucosamine 2-epimerase (non-hydrolysing)